MIAETSAKYVSREEIRTREIARELVQNGYEVIREPTKDQLPEFLKTLSYLPDLLALSEDENLVVEVKSRPSVRGDDKISAIADAVNRQKSWRFLFVYSNPRNNRARDKFSSEQDTRALRIALNEVRSKTTSLTDPTDFKAYFLYAWGLLEATLQASSMRPKKSSFGSSYTLVRNARIDGLISEEQFDELRELQQKRNALVHGLLDTDLNPNEVQMMLDLGAHVLAQIDQWTNQP